MARFGSPLPSSPSLRHHSRNQIFHCKSERQAKQADFGSRSRLYIRALRTLPNLTIKYGHFLTHTVPMYLATVTPPQRVWVEKTEEKGSDVNLATHLVRDAFRKQFEVAVLITNDSDLAEPVRIVAQELHMPVGILNPHQHHSKELQRAVRYLREENSAGASACQPVPHNSARCERVLFKAGWLVAGRPD